MIGSRRACQRSAADAALPMDVARPTKSGACHVSTRPTGRAALRSMLISAVVGLAVVPAGAADHHADRNHGQDAAVGAMRILDPWTRAPVPAGRNAAVYLVMANDTDGTERLVGVESPAARAAELHTVDIDADGVARMRPLADGITVEPGGQQELKPGGFHIMLIGLNQDIAASSSIPLVLRFASGSEIGIEVPARSTHPSGSHPAESGAGHSMPEEHAH